MQEQVSVGGLHTCAVHGVLNTLDQRAVRRQRLSEHQPPAGFVEGCQVGECSANIDGDSKTAFGLCLFSRRHDVYSKPCKVCPELITGVASRCCLGVSLDNIAKDADAVDLHFDDVTILHVNWWLATISNASRCSGGDYIARVQRGEFGDVGNDDRHRENQVGERSLLHDLAFKACTQSDRAKIRDLFGGHQCGTESTRVGKVLAGGPLCSVTLPIAHSDIVVAGIPRNVRAHGVFGDVTPSTTDHDREFALVVERSREAWSQNRGFVRDLRIGKPREDRRVLGLGPFCFRAMAYIIQADAEDLLRIWNNRQKLHLIDWESRRTLLLRILQLAQRTGGQHRSQVAVARAHTAADIDDALVLQEAIAADAVSFKRDHFHYSKLREILGPEHTSSCWCDCDHGDNSSRTRPLVSGANKTQIIPPTA